MPVSFESIFNVCGFKSGCLSEPQIIFFLGRKITSANIFALIPLVLILVNVQKDSSNIEILVSTVMRYIIQNIIIIV